MLLFQFYSYNATPNSIPPRNRESPRQTDDARTAREARMSVSLQKFEFRKIYGWTYICLGSKKMSIYFLQVMMVKKMQETDTENEIREAYRVFDKERTGGIAVSEMRLILSNLPEKLSDEEIEEMLQTADKDGNGYFSYDEFRMMIGATLSMKLK